MEGEDDEGGERRDGEGATVAELGDAEEHRRTDTTENPQSHAAHTAEIRGGGVQRRQRHPQAAHQLDADRYTGDDAAGHEHGLEEPGGRGHRSARHTVLQRLDQCQAGEHGDDAGRDDNRRRDMDVQVPGEVVGQGGRDRRDDAAEEILEEQRQALPAEPEGHRHDDRGGDQCDQ